LIWDAKSLPTSVDLPFVQDVDQFRLENAMASTAVMVPGTAADGDAVDKWGDVSTFSLCPGDSQIKDLSSG